jgi:hypothetical protein
VWGLSGLQDVGGWPSDVLLLSNVIGNGTYGISYAANNLYKYTFTVALGELDEGRDYHFSLGSFFGGIYTVSAPKSIGLTVYAGFYSGSDLIGAAFLFDEIYTAPVGSLNEVLFQEFADTMFYDFVGQSGYTTMELVIEGRALGTGASSAAQPMWFGFVDAKVVAGPSNDEKWQDEQRGFWQRVLDFLEGIMNAILSIGDFFANIGDWIVHLVVPTQDEIQEVVDNFMRVAEEHLGFVVQLPQIFGRLLEAIKVNTEGEDVVITLPKAYLPEAFGGVTLWEEQEFNVSQLVNSIVVLKMFYGVYQVLASVLLFGLILRFIYKIAGRILGENVSAEDVSDRDT